MGRWMYASLPHQVGAQWLCGEFGAVRGLRAATGRCIRPCCWAQGLHGSLTMAPLSGSQCLSATRSRRASPSRQAHIDL